MAIVISKANYYLRRLFNAKIVYCIFQKYPFLVLFVVLILFLMLRFTEAPGAAPRGEAPGPAGDEPPWRETRRKWTRCTTRWWVCFGWFTLYDCNFKHVYILCKLNKLLNAHGIKNLHYFQRLEAECVMEPKDATGSLSTRRSTNAKSIRRISAHNRDSTQEEKHCEYKF